MSDTVLDVRNLEVHFRNDGRLVRAIDGISFQLQRGQTLGIVGESGSGKSVTALSVMGLVPNPPGRIAGGEIWFRPEGREPVNLVALSQEQLRQYRGGEISMIFQEPMSSLNPVYTCGFQLVEALRFHNPDMPEPEARRQAINLLQEVKLLPSDEDLEEQVRQDWYSSRPISADSGAKMSDRDLMLAVNERKQAILKRYPHELSGGQIQRVMIAMAIACDPSILIADEPTTALDVTVQATILDLLRELRAKRDMSIMFITHDLGIVAEIADVVAVMYRGKIVEFGPVLEIFSNPKHPYTRGLLTCRPQPDRRLRYLPTVSDFMEVETGVDGQIIIREKPQDASQALRIFAEVEDGEVRDRLTQLQTQTPLVNVKDLQVGFPIRGVLGRTQQYFMAVNGVSFEVYPGETLGLVGESGCGKSTLSRTLLRLIPSMGGSIEFEGRDITKASSQQLRQIRRDMQIIFQDPFSSLDPRMSIKAAVMEPLKIHKVARSKRNLEERVAYLLERVGLNPAWGDRFPHEFSGGQRQRICIARALALNPKFIICDESVSALDVSVQAQVLNLLKALQDEFKLTYIFISHDLSVVKFMSDRIMVMNRGRVEEIGPADQVYRHPEAAYTQKLIAAIPTGSIDAIRQQQLQRDAS
ncbi:MULTISPECIES: ABC transporter ATP-binding protein [unclassified Leptolyngbya]|uniref:ABC transporter ATP-binding protein n=1 Tax=unclassified Leptolyngbya TaxID=2650499 RepID=UPI0016828CC1|nr:MULTISPECIES: ABC transporter ATP-binding protein [unclassified Leptolyngbya]MBD1910480.1 ABC transporter ATP-binding protein [Leptolyngbya sp. FACHB-8]MBD2153647.1 ABC transporter ATP-binding protein [Leptolyngbya sp. FACHB-16]